MDAGYAYAIVKLQLAAAVYYAHAAEHSVSEGGSALAVHFQHLAEAFALCARNLHHGAD